mmetsp:Transcript_72164/g.192502  ORF Transcript_72164/g.192502 Transcript_72164/m.192502 type:complete len:212 (-) Transcript_72164:427-1062(-)
MILVAVSSASISWARSFMDTSHSSARFSQSSWVSPSYLMSSLSSLVVASRSPSAVALTSRCWAKPLREASSCLLSKAIWLVNDCFTFSYSKRDVISALSASAFCPSALSNMSPNKSRMDELPSWVSYAAASGACVMESSSWACSNAANFFLLSDPTAAASMMTDKERMTPCISGVATAWIRLDPFFSAFSSTPMARSRVSMASTNSLSLAK